ncbi:MAG: MFS transporter [Verrucomicrobiota bacterium]
MANRWLLWVLATLMLGFINLEFYAVGAVAAKVDESFGIGPSRTGLLFGIFTLFYGALQIPVGLAYARFNPVRLLLVACIVFAVGNLLFAFSPGFGLAILGRVISGIGGSCFFLGFVAIASRNFEPQLYARLLGFNQTFKFSVLLVALVLMPTILLHFGWRIYFAMISGVFLCLSVPLAVIATRRVERHETTGESGAWQGLLDLVRNPQIIRYLVIGLFSSGGIIAFSGLWYLPYAERLGYPPKDADLLVSAMMLAMGIGMALSGWISDWLKLRKPILVIGLVVTLLSTSVVCFSAKIPPWLEIGTIFICAGASSAFYAMAYVMVKELVPARLITTANGILNTAIFMGAALLQYLPGLILRLEHGGAGKIDDATVTGFQLALLIFPVGYLISLIASLGLKETGGAQCE